MSKPIPDICNPACGAEPEMSAEEANAILAKYGLSASEMIQNYLNEQVDSVHTNGEEANG